jgi:prepilin signal peptidase PulO-like enzyme (type II secretory pathway)
LANLFVIIPQVPDSVIEFLSADGAKWRPLADAIGSAAFGYGMLLFVRVGGQMLFRREAMGMGDLKLFACIGAFLGWLNSLYVLMIACVLGSIIGGSQLIFHRLSARKAAQGGLKAKALHPLPFGPYIAVAAVITLLFHEQIPVVLNAFTHLFDKFYGISPEGF